MTQLDIAKTFLMDLTSLERDALHIYVALVIFVGSCLIFGWKTWQWKPLLLVLLAALLGEIWDIYGSMSRSEPIPWWGSWHDVWNTVLVPAVLVVLTRYSTIFGSPPAPHPHEPGQSGEEELGDQP